MSIPSATASSGVVARVATGQLNNSTRSLTFAIQPGDGFAFQDTDTYVVAWRSDLYANSEDDPLARIGIMSSRTSHSLTVEWGALGTSVSALSGTVLVAQLFRVPSSESIETVDSLITARRGTYNVKDYGVVGDGVTDDTAAIRTLIDLLPVQGGEIFFPDGVYIITSTIVVKHHGVSFRGVTSASTYADQSAMQPGVRGISVIQASLTSFPASTPMLVWGELGTNKMWTGGGIQNMSILGTKGTTTPGDGIQLINVQACHVYDSIIGGVARAVYVASDQTGGTSNVNVDRNIIYNLTSHGVYMDAGSDENYVRFNYIVNPVGYAIAFNAGIGNTAIGNHINGTVLAGSGTADGTAFFIQGTRSFVKDNDILSCASNGVYVGANKSQVQVIGNYIGNPNSSSVASGAGIWVTGTGTDILISDNNINDNSSKVVYGIRDTTTGGGVTIGPNAIRGYTTAKFISTNGLFQSLILPGKMSLGAVTDPTAVLNLAASTTSASSLNVASGTAPTSPNNGDIWFDGTNLKIQVGGVTKTVTLT